MNPKTEKQPAEPVSLHSPTQANTSLLFPHTPASPSDTEFRCFL